MTLYCQRGHLRTPESTGRRSDGCPYCRICRREDGRRRPQARRRFEQLVSGTYRPRGGPTLRCECGRMVPARNWEKHTKSCLVACYAALKQPVPSAFDIARAIVGLCQFRGNTP